MNRIKESDLEIKYGMINYGDERKGAKHSFCYIVNDVQDIKSNYFRLGFHLQEFFKFGYYRDFGYPSFKDFIEKNTDLKYSTVKHCMNVYNKFCRHNENGTKTMFIEDKYEPYTYSQLQEMSSMTPNQLNACNPSMTISDMRSLKRKDKESADIGTCEKEEKKNDEMSFFEGFLAQGSYSAFLQMVGELFENKSNEQIKVCEIVGKTMKFEFDEKKYKIVLSELKE